MESKETKNIISNITYGHRTYNSIIRMSIPYIKFGLLGFTLWGDMNNNNVNEWRFLGFKLN